MKQATILSTLMAAGLLLSGGVAFAESGSANDTSIPAQVQGFFGDSSTPADSTKKKSMRKQTMHRDSEPSAPTGSKGASSGTPTRSSDPLNGPKTGSNTGGGS